MKTLENNAELLQDLSIEEMENVNGGLGGIAHFLKWAQRCIEAYDIASGFDRGWSGAGSSRSFSWE